MTYYPETQFIPPNQTDEKKNAALLALYEAAEEAANFVKRAVTSLEPAPPGGLSYKERVETALKVLEIAWNLKEQ